MDLTFEVDDLQLDDIVVTSMRDSVGLPESAASGTLAIAISCSCNSCSGSGSCCCTN